MTSDCKDLPLKREKCGTHEHQYGDKRPRQLLKTLTLVIHRQAEVLEDQVCLIFLKGWRSVVSVQTDRSRCCSATQLAQARFARKWGGAGQDCSLILNGGIFFILPRDPRTSWWTCLKNFREKWQIVHLWSCKCQQLPHSDIFWNVCRLLL